MVKRHNKPLTFTEYLAVVAGNFRVREKEVHREAAEGNDKFGINDLNLTFLVRIVGADFFRQRIAVLGRSALYDVRDIHTSAFPADFAEQSV